MTTYTVYKSTDDSGANYDNAPVVSKHKSLKQAVKYLAKSESHILLRDSDNAEFHVSYRKNNEGWGAWVNDIGTVEQNVKF